MRYGYFVNPGTNALLALQGQCAGRGAVSVSDLLRNPHTGRRFKLANVCVKELDKLDCQSDKMADEPGERDA
ncbi:MAG: hypothetical protein BWY63_01140 [Chloroflexi bacterium ADurb.Bin360]|nr:MAG: hypothetical protein BWY63_01140 [Chloroflexi bacterium ADurb.Bin360]